jgi:hypothetical protein
MIAGTPTQRSAIRSAKVQSATPLPAHSTVVTVATPLLLTARTAPLCGLVGGVLCVESVGRDGVALLMTGIALVLAAIGLSQLARARLGAQLEAEALARGEDMRGVRERTARAADALLVALCRHAPVKRNREQR